MGLLKMFHKTPSGSLLTARAAHVAFGATSYLGVVRSCLLRCKGTLRSVRPESHPMRVWPR